MTTDEEDRRAGIERGNAIHDVLAALDDGPHDGYDIILTLEKRRGFRPDPAAVFPTLDILDDAHWTTSLVSGDTRVYSITDAGRALLAAERLLTG